MSSYTKDILCNWKKIGAMISMELSQLQEWTFYRIQNINATHIYIYKHIFHTDLLDGLAEKA